MMIKSIKLKEKDILFIKEACGIDIIPKYISNSHFENKSKSWTLLLETEDLELISDELSKALMDKGISNGEINSFGMLIEDYIDKFNYYE